MEYNARFLQRPWRGARAWLRRNDGLALRMVIGLAVAVALLIVFARLVNLGPVWLRLEHLNVGLALLCSVAFLGAYVVRALRWRLFLRASGYQPPVARVVMIYQVAMFVNWLLPIRGGELVKSLLLRRLDGIPISESLSTVVMDKALDLAPAIVLLLLLPFMPFHLSQALWTLLLLALLALALGAAFLGLAAWRRQTALALLHRGVSWLPQRARGVEPFLTRFLDVALLLAARPGVLLRAALLTVVAVTMDALFCLLAFAAVGSWIAFPVVLFGYTFFNLAFILPTPPGQIGSNELIGLLIFHGVFGVSATGVAAMFLFSHPWTAALMVVSGLLCLSAMGLSMRSAFALTRATDLPALDPPEERRPAVDRVEAGDRKGL